MNPIQAALVLAVDPLGLGGARLRGCCKKRGRLRFDDGEIHFKRRFEVLLRGELQDFAFGDYAGGARKNLQHAQVARCDHQFERL